MSFEPSSDEQEQMAAVLSVREQWRLLCWMEAHPAALEHELTTGQSPQRRNASRHSASGPRRAPLAYAVGLAVGTLWMLLRKALE